ncbi:hypothetical protein QUF74_12095 [Candidatus Halobeggiatoa sp. HSG11]|nr:hypothetical protein [Candidatus Halobeggiatoa sp. HSG11]
MKKLILPTVVSLALCSSYVFAEEQVQAAPEAPVPAITAPIPPSMAVPPPVNPDMEKYRLEMEKRMAEQRAAMEKRMAEQQAAIKEQIEQQQKKYQEMMEKRNAKMQEMQKRHEKMRSENVPSAPPAWTNRPAPVAPNWNAYTQPPRNNYRPSPMQHRSGHHADVEQSLQNIEKLLGQVIEILQKK